MPDFGKYVSRLPASTPPELARALADVFRDLTDDKSSVERKVDLIVLATDFGAKCDFTTDDSTAIQAALDSGALCVFLPGNTAIATKLTIPAGVMLAGIGRVSIKKLANIDMIEMSTNSSRLSRIRLEGQGGTYTGRGIIIGAGTDQKLHDVEVADMNGYCLEFTANDVGGRFVWDVGFAQRTTATDKAIKLPGGDSSTFGDRTFSKLKSGGGVLFYIDGASMTIVDGCNFVADTTMFGSAAKQALFSNCRIAGSSWDVDGLGHLIANCSIAPDITIQSGASLIHIANCNVAGSLTVESGVTNSRFESTTFQGGVADHENNTSNHVDVESAFTPTWGADTTNPTLGNGTITGRYRRKGKHVRVDIRLDIGSTTTFGTGAWFFELPSGINHTVKHAAVGIARAVDTGTANYVAAVTALSGAAPKLYLVSSGGSSFWGPTTPHTWATSDVLIISAEWEIG